MARSCAVCGKGVRTGHSISHAHVKTNRRWVPNLQRVRVKIDGVPQRAYVCAKCLKAGKVDRAM